MREIKIKNWRDFEIKLKELHAKLQQIKDGTTLLVPNFLFRGQSNSEWKLDTTLERYTDNEEIVCTDYYSKIYHLRHQIETFTGHRWNLPDTNDYEPLEEPFSIDTKPLSNTQSYMAYLRHHGFPSPLLDWTKSPYIAAFFAFNEIIEENNSVAVYAYIEHIDKGRGMSYGKPWIESESSSLNAHKRHFLQQSVYTRCREHKDPFLFYAKHEEVPNDIDGDQNLLWKFIIPATEQTTFLERLQTMNINAYSLFGSEESLMSTLASRAFKL